jgi:hypothetical protein
MSISINESAPSAIPSLDELTIKAADWLDRDDLTSKIPTFILLAEAMFNRELRCPQMEATITFSVSAEDTPMPAQDYLSMRSIYIEGDPDRPLRATSPSSVRQEYSGIAGIPEAYILVSGGIRLVPPPDTTYSLTMDYYRKITPLSVIAPSNWLLETHPDAYLYAVLFFAESFLDNATRAAQWKGLVVEIIGRINESTKLDRYGAGPISRLTSRQTCGGRC